MFVDLLMRGSIQLKRVANVATAMKTAFLAFGSSTTLACASPAVAPPPPDLTANPTSITFANLQAPAQQLTVSGSATLSTNSGGESGSCFNLTQTSQKGTTVTFSVSPASSQFGACPLFLGYSTISTIVPVAVGVQAPLGTPVAYKVEMVSLTAAAGNAISLSSSNAGVASVPATGTTAKTSSGLPYVPFTITPNAIGTAVIHVFESGTSAPATFSIPVTVTSGSGGTPTPAPTVSPTSAPTLSPTPAPTLSPTPTASPSGSTFTLANASTQTFSLSGSPVAAQVSFFGQVTVQGASSENVTYSELAGLPTNGCTVTGTIVDAITLTFPTAFTFAPNGSGGPSSGLLDTLFAPPSPSGTYYGEVFKAGTCSTPFAAASQAISTPPSSYEYFGSGNTSVPAGTYILELYH